MLKLNLVNIRFIRPPNLVSREQKQQALDVEEGVIPDSPVLTSSFSMVNRMRRKKENRHIRYTEHTHPDLELAKSNSGKRWYCLVGVFFTTLQYFKGIKSRREKFDCKDWEQNRSISCCSAHFLVCSFFPIYAIMYMSVCVYIYEYIEWKNGFSSNCYITARSFVLTS